MKQKKNIPASVKQLLLNISKKNKRPFAELLQYYAMERFLYRLSQSSYNEKFILKGALMLRARQLPSFRATKDIDLLGITSNKEDTLKKIIEDIITIGVEPDGLIFKRETIRTEQITANAEYKGIRVCFICSLDSAKINMQIDIGFGDIVYPDPEKLEMPVILDLPAPKILCYSTESAIAEKLEAMVSHGSLNSRNCQ